MYQGGHPDRADSWNHPVGSFGMALVFGAASGMRDNSFRRSVIEAGVQGDSFG